MAQYSINEIKGVIPAMFTTFDEKGNLDLDAVPRLIEFLLSKGVTGFYLTGSNGCGFFMDTHERKALVETAVKTIAKRVPVIVHIGHVSTNKSIDLAKHAESVGADAVSSVPPIYFRFTQEDLFAYYKDISESVNIPMVIYNIPNAGAMSFDFITRLASIENVKGIKYTSKDHEEMGRLKTVLGNDFMVYSGVDQMATSGILSGSDGLIGGYYNIIPEIFIELWTKAHSNDFFGAHDLQLIANELIFLFKSYDFPVLASMVLQSMGINICAYQKPYQIPSNNDVEKLKQGIAEIKARHPVTHIDFIDKTIDSCF